MERVSEKRCVQRGEAPLIGALGFILKNFISSGVSPKTCPKLVERTGGLRRFKFLVNLLLHAPLDSLFFNILS